MLTRTVLAVAVRAMDTAEKAKAVGSFTIAAVPRPCALPPCARPLAAGSFTLSAAAAAVTAAATEVVLVACEYTHRRGRRAARGASSGPPTGEDGVEAQAAVTEAEIKKI